MKTGHMELGGVSGRVSGTLESGAGRQEGPKGHIGPSLTEQQEVKPSDGPQSQPEPHREALVLLGKSRQWL